MGEKSVWLNYTIIYKEIAHKVFFYEI